MGQPRKAAFGKVGVEPQGQRVGSEGDGASPARRPRSLWRRTMALVAAAWLIGQIGWVAIGPNFHTVVPRICFRSGQPSPAHLAQWIHLHDIRTIVNLRGENPDREWYRQEMTLSRQLAVAHVDVAMSSHNKPEKWQLRKLLDTLETVEPPVLLHCHQGSDRSGFASACFLLLRTNASLSEAQCQLSLRFGHIALGRPAVQDRVLQLYGEWLDESGLVHTPQHLKTWVRQVYEKDDWTALEPGHADCLHAATWVPPLARRFHGDLWHAHGH